MTEAPAHTEVQHHTGNGVVPPEVSQAAADTVAKYNSVTQHQQQEPAYVSVIEDVDTESLGKPYTFRLPRRFAEIATTDEERERASRAWRLTNAKALDWQKLEELDKGPRAMFRMLLGEEQFAEFAKIEGVQQALVDNIMQDYQRYFGLGERGK